MRDRITANLPAIDMGETQAFYERLGFATLFRDAGWMVMRRETLELEFFPHAELKPGESWFSACLRIADVDALHAEWSGLGLPAEGIPRMGPVKDEPPHHRIFYFIDLNGSLLRCMSPLGDV